ncbi:carbohydrate binding domain-containing protein [Micromonospora sp. WMMD1102]|uniref:carbohydrate binding domain-containing protein n=1 Tax=Micromonospora sp. WMMD1102 TaxID=3016105 RepID=UPI0024150637|nr:carbohydrate binding domain-containing protein [Micromonospora sp. WMMD1102]MDG4792019.1 carbohydrate binding domain-containing protein [Micromonospora sp. WMMD1102]
MSDYDLRFVDTVSSTAATRLDLRVAPFSVQSDTEFGMPELRRSAVSTLLVDGERYPAAAYDNRLITLVLKVIDASEDATAALLQTLYRELDRPSNVLRYQPGTSAPIFFRTFRAGPSSVIWDPVQKQVVARIPAEPFAVGLPETTGALTVYNDPGLPGGDLNANPYFETNAASWTGVGGTVARSTAQFHEGAASLLLTPDGVTATVEARSEMVPVAVGQRYRASVWVRCSSARSITLALVWFNSIGGTITAATQSASVSAGVWTLIEFERSAPDLPSIATQARIAVSLASTPPAGHTTWIDEARLRLVGAGGGMYADLPDILGDVETPLRVTIPQGGTLLDTNQMSLMAIRRRGTPSGAPMLLQAESLTQGGGTTVQTNSSDASGPGGNYSRCTFASVDPRLSSDVWPLMDTPDVRGRYRVLARIRTTVATDVIYATIRWGLNAYIAGLAETSVGWDGTAGSTAWRIVDLGLISFPSGADPTVDGLTGSPLPARGQFLRLDARRQSGTGNLDIDYLLFVPADDRLLIVRWNDIKNNEGGDVVIDSAQEVVYGIRNGVVYGGGSPPAITGWMYASPGTANRLYWLRSVGPLSSDDITNQTLLTIEYVPRYLYVRPVAS